MVGVAIVHSDPELVETTLSQGAVLSQTKKALPTPFGL